MKGLPWWGGQQAIHHMLALQATTSGGAETSPAALSVPANLDPFADGSEIKRHPFSLLVSSSTGFMGSRPVPYRVQGPMDGILEGPEGHFATSTTSRNCHILLRLQSATYLDRVQFRNNSTTYLSILAGPGPSVLAPVLQRTSTNSMLRHKTERGREQQHVLQLAIPDVKCESIRLVLEQPYEPWVPIGLAAVTFFGCETPPRPPSVRCTPFEMTGRLKVIKRAPQTRSDSPEPEGGAEGGSEDDAEDTDHPRPASSQSFRDVLVRRNSSRQRLQTVGQHTPPPPQAPVTLAPLAPAVPPAPSAPPATPLDTPPQTSAGPAVAPVPSASAFRAAAPPIAPAPNSCCPETPPKPTYPPASGPTPCYTSSRHPPPCVED